MIMGESSFLLADEVKAMFPVEVEVPTSKHENFDEESNHVYHINKELLDTLTLKQKSRDFVLET